MARRTGLTSSSLRLPLARKPAVLRWETSPASGKRARTWPARSLPKTDPRVVRLSTCLPGGLRWADRRRFSVSCRYAVATGYPLGNCDSSRVRNPPGLLDSLRSGFFSLLSAQFLFRESDDARPSPEELVNPAFGRCLAARVQRGSANQLGSSFPQLPGIILELFGGFLASATGTSVLSMNWPETTRMRRSDNRFL